MNKKILEIIAIITCLIFLLISHNNAYASSASRQTRISFASVRGNEIVDENGKEIRFRGIQIDFGSARGDMPLWFKGSAKIERFLDRIMDYVITEDDFVTIKDMGANMVRLSLNTYKDYENDSQPFTYREENFKKLDKVIAWAQKHNIYLIISMRQSPGGHNSSPHSGNNGLNKLWSNREYQKRLVALWKTIASRYAKDPIIAGYDLLNEPDAPNKEILNKVYREITKGIRGVGDKHIIFLEGNLWATQLDWIQPPLDLNTALSIHFYVPFSYIKGKGTYPAEIKGRVFDKNALRERLKKRLAYGQRLNRPVWVGEFGAKTKADNYLQYDKDVIQLFEELNLSWNYWTYKSFRGITDGQALYYNRPDSKIIQLISEIKKSKRAFSTFTKQDLKEALESLQTANFVVKRELKELLTNSILQGQK